MIFGVAYFLMYLHFKYICVCICMYVCVCIYGQCSVKFSYMNDRMTAKSPEPDMIISYRK